MSLTHKTAELRRLVEEMVYQSRKVDDQTANGPHVDVSCQELRLLEHLQVRARLRRLTPLVSPL